VRPSILIADDDPMLREFLQDLLTAEGCLVRCAVDGDDALAQALADQPDLVLTDFRMPGMDGLSLLTHLRERGLDIPVVLMSAHMRNAPPQVTFLPKPFDLNRLLRALASALPSLAVLAQPAIDDPSISKSIT
jgi:CheY-like chemotaxis protein